MHHHIQSSALFSILFRCCQRYCFDHKQKFVVLNYVGGKNESKYLQNRLIELR